MKYKLRNNYSKDPQEALIDILKDRGVKDVENFVKPSNKCELNPYDLKNIESAAEMLLKHLKKSPIIIACDLNFSSDIGSDNNCHFLSFGKR